MNQIQKDVSKYNMESPLGRLCIEFIDGSVTRLDFCTSENNDIEPVDTDAETISNSIINQLTRYFDNKLRDFDLPFTCSGTEFQKRVWSEITDIPYGMTTTYGEIAASLGNKKSVRAVGRAVGANPIPIIIPCHRVVGTNGKLTGYSGGLWRKKWLLKHEKITIV